MVPQAHVRRLIPSLAGCGPRLASSRPSFVSWRGPVDSRPMPANSDELFPGLGQLPPWPGKGPHWGGVDRNRPDGGQICEHVLASDVPRPRTMIYQPSADTDSLHAKRPCWQYCARSWSTMDSQARGHMEHPAGGHRSSLAATRRSARQQRVSRLPEAGVGDGERAAAACRLRSLAAHARAGVVASVESRKPEANGLGRKAGG